MTESATPTRPSCPTWAFFSWLRLRLLVADRAVSLEMAFEILAVGYMARSGAGWLRGDSVGGTRIIEITLLAELLICGYDPVDIARRIDRSQENVRFSKDEVSLASGLEMIEAGLRQGTVRAAAERLLLDDGWVIYDNGLATAIGGVMYGKPSIKQKRLVLWSIPGDALYSVSLMLRGHA